jgi:hypothetical protein
MVARLAAENIGTVVVGVEWLFKLGMLAATLKAAGPPAFEKGKRKRD